MSGQVLVSRKLLTAVLALLVVCLTAVAFLLGQRHGAAQPGTTAHFPAAPSQTSTPESVMVSPTAAETAPSLEQRLDALDQQVSTVRQRTNDPASSPTPASLQPSATNVTQDAGVAEYLKRVDETVGASAMTGPLPISAKLLERAMKSDPSLSDGLIQQTNQAKSQLAALPVPPSCQEHHRLLLGQLAEAVVLLREVQTADSTGDTARLAALAESSFATQDEATRLYQLDRELRLGLR